MVRKNYLALNGLSTLMPSMLMVLLRSIGPSKDVNNRKLFLFLIYRILLIPGSALLNKWLMGFVYFVWLMWMFVGVAIISDIFMESIEVITS